MPTLQYAVVVEVIVPVKGEQDTQNARQAAEYLVESQVIWPCKARHTQLFKEDGSGVSELGQDSSTSA
jgi:hypothetical protein